MPTVSGYAGFVACHRQASILAAFGMNNLSTTSAETIKYTIVSRRDVIIVFEETLTIFIDVS